MLDIENKGYQPTVDELRAFVGNPLFDAHCRYMDETYRAKACVEYSGDPILPGWNLKFKKAGRTLCTAYPRPGHFPLLIIVGRKEKERLEALLPTLSEAFQTVYRDTKEGMGQRWLLFDFADRTDAYDDVLKLIRIRRARQ